MIKATGADNKLVYSGKQDDRVYQLEGGAIQTIPQASSQPPPAANREERIAQGKTTYTAICMACHQAEGQGIIQAFPPLAKSDYLNADPKRAISTAWPCCALANTRNSMRLESFKAVASSFKSLVGGSTATLGSVGSLVWA